MRVSIHSIAGELESIEDEDPAIVAALAQAAILRWHAARPQDTFELRLEGDEECRLLRITCPQCQVTQEQELEPWFVGAAALAFHTSHEGHPLCIEYAGRVLQSPPRNAGHPLTKPMAPVANPNDDLFVQKMKAEATAALGPLKADPGRFNEAASAFHAVATVEWVRGLMDKPDAHIHRVRVKPIRGNSGVNEAGEFLLYANVAVQVRDETGNRKMVFPYVEVFDNPSIPAQG